MIRLCKFYELINRNALVTLTNTDLEKVYYEGPLRDIPDEYNDSAVEDFAISNKGDFLFKITIRH